MFHLPGIRGPGLLLLQLSLSRPFLSISDRSAAGGLQSLYLAMMTKYMQNGMLHQLLEVVLSAPTGLDMDVFKSVVWERAHGLDRGPP